MPTPTLSSLSEELGLSRGTVSYIVNGRGRDRGISESTERRVLAHLARRGYNRKRRLPVQDRRLRHDGDAIGIIAPGGLYNHLLEAQNLLMRALTGTARTASVLIADRHQRADALAKLIDDGASHAILLQHSPEMLEYAELDELLPLIEQLSVIVYNFRFEDAGIEAALRQAGAELVGFRRADGMIELGRFLHQLGHRHVFLPLGDSDVALPALEGEGLQVTCFHLPMHGYQAKQALIAAQKLARRYREDGFTAVCFGNDDYAGHVMIELQRMGVHVPEDLTVTGFPGMPPSAAFSKPLTAITVPYEDMVRRTLDLLEFPRQPGAEGRSWVFTPGLIERESHAAPTSANDR